MANASDTTKSEKYAQAVSKATGKDMAVTGGAATGDLMKDVKDLGPDAMKMIATYEDPRELAQKIGAELASGGYEAAPQILSLKEGQMIEGILEGNGPVAEFTNEDTGEVTQVQTWIIADPTGAVRVSILSSAQLDRKLNGFRGGPVKIARGKDVNVSGTKKRMTEYTVWGPRMANGQKRQWFDLSHAERAALEAGKAQPALPAGSGNGVSGGRVIDVDSAPAHQA